MLSLPALLCEGSGEVRHACSELTRSQLACPSTGLEPGIALH